MKLNFWQNLPKPFFALAPMADVTDPAFRQIVAKYSMHGLPGGGPDVFWTEFVSADGLMSPGREILKQDLKYSEGERPIVAQLFSSHPEKMRGAAKLCTELGFDGIDINMGCPDKSIEKQGCGSAMIKTPEIAVQIIQAVKAGIADAVSAGWQTIPVSVKTRVGYNQVQIDEWIPLLLSQNISALTVHARTRKEMSKVPANWEYLKKVVALRDSIAPKTFIIGNGDVTDLADGIERAKKYGVDGIMIGRAIFGNPWLFDHNLSITKRGSWNAPFFLSWLPRNLVKKIIGDARYTRSAVSDTERLSVMLEHAELFEKLLGNIKSFSVMKKHFKPYTAGMKKAKELRMELMAYGNTASEVKKIVEKFLNN